MYKYCIDYLLISGIEDLIEIYVVWLVMTNLRFVSCEKIIDQLEGKHNSLA